MRESGRAEEVGVDKGRASRALAPAQPPDQASHRRDASDDQGADRLAALLPDEDAEDDPAHADDRERGADGVDGTDAGERDVTHQAEPGENDRDDRRLTGEGDPPGEQGGDKAAEQGADGGGDRGCRPTIA